MFNYVQDLGTKKFIVFGWLMLLLQVLKHILECKQWDSISPKQLLETLHELILYGYEVKILTAKKETISPIEWIEQQ